MCEYSSLEILFVHIGLTVCIGAAACVAVLLLAALIKFVFTSD